MNVCPVCLEGYTLTTRRSLIVCSNGHSLCKICREGARFDEKNRIILIPRPNSSEFESYISDRDMRCPTCREQMLTTPIPNRFMQDLILSDTTSRCSSTQTFIHNRTVRII